MVREQDHGLRPLHELAQQGPALDEFVTPEIVTADGVHGLILRPEYEGERPATALTHHDDDGALFLRDGDLRSPSLTTLRDASRITSGRSDRVQQVSG